MVVHLVYLSIAAPIDGCHMLSYLLVTYHLSLYEDREAPKLLESRSDKLPGLTRNCTGSWATDNTIQIIQIFVPSGSINFNHNLPTELLVTSPILCSCSPVSTTDLLYLTPPSLLVPILMKSPFLRFKITIFLEHRFSQKLLRMFFPKELLPS